MQTFINDNQLFSFCYLKELITNYTIMMLRKIPMIQFNLLNKSLWSILIILFLGKLLKDRMSSVIHYITFFKKDRLSYNILAAFHDSEDIFLFDKLLKIVYDNASKLKYDDVLERIIINTIYNNNIDTFNSVVKFIKDNDKISELLKNEDVKGSLLNEAAKNGNTEFVEFF